MKVKISYFKRVDDTVPKTMLLDDWLKGTVKPTKELKEKVLKYRKTKDPNLKKSFPAATISAHLKKERNLKNIKSKSGFLCLDIDRTAKGKNKPSNTCIDMALAKEFLSRHPSTYFCAYSLGGDGIYCLIRLGDTSLKKAFKYFLKALGLHGVNIDESCKDYTRLRFFSYDKKAYWNKKAKAFEIPKEIKRKKSKGNYSTKSNQEKVEAIVSLCEQTGIDITSDYYDWVKIAGALNYAFGEDGRGYFHRLSKLHSEYKEKKTDRKYDSCAKMNKVNLSSLFYIATSYGIRY